jgi:hypothetical protein
VIRTERHWHDQRAGEWRTKTLVDVTPLDHAAAVKWCEDNEAEIIVEFFDLPGEGVPSTSAFPLRMPDALKRRLEASAAAAGVSMNAYTVACLERCLRDE